MILTRILAGLILTATLFGAPAMAVEEPPFQTLLKEGAFEIRDYPALAVAEVTVAGGQKEAASRGFRLLAGYIFGGNEPKQRIAMTAPVTQFKSDDAWIVRFTMPHAYTLATLPAPDNAKVHLRATPPTRFAVIRFSGLAWPDDVAARTAELAAWMRQKHLKSAGPPVLAQYDPPWILWFMRRNEVLIPIEKSPDPGPHP